MEHTIKYLKGYGIDEIVLCVAYLRHRIKEYFHDGKDFGIRIRYAEADQPLGTAGQLATAKDLLRERFLAMNGDIITSLNLRNLVEKHEMSRSVATIALKKFSVEVPYGYVELDSQMMLTSFREKPTLTYQANAGVYVLNSRIFDYIKMPPVATNLERDVFPAMIASGEKVTGYCEDAYWADIGVATDFERVDKELFSKPLEDKG